MQCTAFDGSAYLSTTVVQLDQPSGLRSHLTQAVLAEFSYVSMTAMYTSIHYIACGGQDDLQLLWH